MVASKQWNQGMKKKLLAWHCYISCNTADGWEDFAMLTCTPHLHNGYKCSLNR
jgi:hypothetical protein